MAILKHISGSNIPRCYIGKILAYIYEGYKTGDGQYCGTRGCCNDDPARDFYSVKKAFHKTDGKQGEHFVLSLEANNKASYEECMTVGYEIADYFSDYQVAFAVHKDTNNRHIHFVINSVSYKDGHKFSQGSGDLHNLKTHCNEILRKHNFDIVRMKTCEMHDNEPYSVYNGLGFIEVAENTPKAEQEMNIIVSYDDVENEEEYVEDSYDPWDDDYYDDESDYSKAKKHKKHKKKSKKENKKMSKKKSLIPEIIDKDNNKLKFDDLDLSDKDIDIIAIDNSKNCKIKVKNKEQAAYLAGALFSAANSDDSQKNISDLSHLSKSGKTLRCFINNKKNLSIEIEED